MLVTAFLWKFPLEAKPPQATIINASPKMKVFLYYKNSLLEQKEHFLSPQDTVVLPFDSDSFSPVMVSTPIGNKLSAGVIAMPGDTIYISYNEAQDSYDYTGNHSTELAFSKRLSQSSFRLVGPYDQIAYGSKTDFNYFLDEWRKLWIESEKFIIELKAAQGVREEFKNYLEQEIRLKVFSVLLIPAVLQNPKKPVRPYPQFYQDTVSAHARILYDSKRLPESSSERLVAALRGYAMFLAAREGRYGDFAVQYEIAKREYEGLQREWVCYSALKDLMKRGNGSANLVKDYQSWASEDSKYKNKLLGIKQLNEVSIYKEAAINDIFITPEKKQLRLSDIITENKGKVIYVDLWASWCIPCLREFPASLEIMKRYSPQDLAMVYLSVDKDTDKWLEASYRHLGNNVNSYLLKNEDGSGLVKKYNIKSVPRYMIIDREGVIRYADAPPPSDAILSEILDRLLYPTIGSKP
ncbi:TlpA disulfide reductase family protein [Pontibacter korlensis]